MIDTPASRFAIAEPYFQAFSDARGTGTRYGPVHLLVKESDAAICGTKSRRWNFEGESDDDFCHRCLKEADRRQATHAPAP